MYTKQQASEIRHKFWISFGKYMIPVPSASGEKVNWVNYKTGVKEIRFRMDAQNKEAFVAIEIRGEDEIRKKLYAVFVSMREKLHPGFEWFENCEDEHEKPLSRIYIELSGFNIFNVEHWPAIISFLKKHIISMDAFWKTNKDIFEMSV